jgi:hypothetical protein
VVFLTKWLVCLLLCVRCQATIVQLDSMEQVVDYFQHADCATLGVFDIDMTLIQPVDPAFQMANISKYEDVARQVIFSLPKEKRDIFFSLTTMYSDSVLVDERTPEYLDQLHAQGVTLIALTSSLTGPLAHIASMEEWKREELKSVGIELGSSLSHLGRLDFVHLPAYRGNYATFMDGIIFTNSSLCTKGEALIAFLQESQLHPKEIIFADDKMDHVRGVGEALQHYDPTINYIGIHFLGALHFPSPSLTEEEFMERWTMLAAQALTLH